MNYTKDDTLEMSNDIKRAYNLVKQLKNEIDFNINNNESKEKVNDIINQVSEILEETTSENIVDTENQEEKEKRVLLISAKNQNVILPYNKEQIQKFIECGKYKTEEEVIENEYTIPLSRYKNESLSRVVEGYKLARKKDANSMYESLKYAMNLIFERRLHPAIITACNTVDELDIYLACLDENVTELFDFFEVVFEYPPMQINKDKEIE